MKRSMDTGPLHNGTPSDGFGITMEDIVKFEATVKSSNLDGIRKLYKTINVPKTITSFANIAVERRELHIFVWLLSEGFHSSAETSTKAFKRVVKEGEIGRMKQIFRLTTIAKTNTDFTTEACFKGHLHILKWLVTNGFGVDTGICTELLDVKRYQIFQWLWENNIREDHWGAEYFTEPASDGNIEFFEWAKENDYHWTYDFTTIIGEDGAYHGHLDLIQWAEANGCPLHWVTCRAAFRGEQYEVLKWLIDRNYHNIEPNYDYDGDDDFTVELMMVELKKLGKL